MDCQEIREDLRATAASYSAQRQQSAQLLLRLLFSNRRSITPSPGSCWGIVWAREASSPRPVRRWVTKFENTT